jgi:hypothetical protein
MKRLLDGLEKPFMMLRLHAEVTIHAQLGPVLDEDPDQTITPDQANALPWNRSDQA